MLARQNERQKNIILQGEGIKQVEILKNKPEVLAAERSNLFLADGRECTAVLEHLTLRGTVKRRQDI